MSYVEQMSEQQGSECLTVEADWMSSVQEENIEFRLFPAIV